MPSANLSVFSIRRTARRHISQPQETYAPAAKFCNAPHRTYRRPDTANQDGAWPDRQQRYMALQQLIRPARLENFWNTVGMVAMKYRCESGNGAYPPPYSAGGPKSGVTAPPAGPSCSMILATLACLVRSTPIRLMMTAACMPVAAAPYRSGT